MADLDTQRGGSRSLLDSTVVRLCAVFAALGCAVLVVCAGAIYPENAWIVQWVALGAGVVVLLAGLVVGIVWAFDDREDPS